MEAHAPRALEHACDRVEQAMMQQSDRASMLREMIDVCRHAGIRAIPGVYGAVADKISAGVLTNGGLTVRTGRAHVNRWTDDLVERTRRGESDPRRNEGAPLGRGAPWSWFRSREGTLGGYGVEPARTRRGRRYTSGVAVSSKCHLG